MNTDGRKWHYLAVKGFSALPRGWEFLLFKLFSFIQYKKINLKNMKVYVMIMIVVM